MSKKLDLDGFINRLRAAEDKRVCISEDDVINLCDIAKRSFLQQETLLRIRSPVKICGDVHGQFSDLLKLLNMGGCPSTTKYLFLGDYVDRGKKSVETICLLLSLKCRYPNSFFLIRGNHELAPLNRFFGFYDEMKRRFKDRNFLKLYVEFNKVFNCMPLAAVIDKKAFCCHGGISPLLKSMKCITAIKRPSELLPSKDGLASDILWSDPSEEIEDWEKQDQPNICPRHRGIGYFWGANAHANFLRKNKFNLVIRAHECVDGYRWTFGKQLVTVFSAPNYSEDNYAAIGTYENGNITFQRFR